MSAVLVDDVGTGSDGGSMITGRAWHDLPIVIIMGLVIGLAFGQAVMLFAPVPTTTVSQAKH
jgi:hypothetical protein